MRNIKLKNTASFFNGFFKTNLNKDVFSQAPLLVGIYCSWLSRSTMGISNKQILIENTHTETALLEAIHILKNNYKSELIPKRNKEILELFNSS
jgi:hypothetical protein